MDIRLDLGWFSVRGDPPAPWYETGPAALTSRNVRFRAIALPGVLDAVVIGAGHAGLAVSFRLSRAALDHVVLERGEVGETWRSQRWDSFQLNTPTWMNSLPGRPYDGEPDAFAPRHEWIAYLGAYATAAGLPIVTRTAVTSVEEDDGALRVKTSTGRMIRTRNVIVASGILNMAKVPTYARDLDGSIAVLTTASYKNAALLPPGAVLVVGGGQSAVQIAEDLLDAGREVFLCASRVGRCPRRARGRDSFFWLDECGWFWQRPADLPDPAMMRQANPQISGVGPRGHSVSYQSLARRGTTLLGHVEGAAGTRIHLSGDLAEHVRFADERSAFLRKTIDEHIASRGIEAALSEPDPADEPVADASRYKSPTELDLRERGIGSVIFATGFVGDFSWLRLPALDAQGVPLQQEGRSPVPGLWFIGFPWLRFRSSGIMRGVFGDSEMLLGKILAHLRSGAAVSEGRSAT